MHAPDSHRDTPFVANISRCFLYTGLKGFERADCLRRRGRYSIADHEHGGGSLLSPDLDALWPVVRDLCGSVFIVVGLILLAALQMLPALLFIAIVGFVTAVLQLLLLSRIQQEVYNDIRATTFSMQSLMFTLLLTITAPILGHVADRSGLPSA